MLNPANDWIPGAYVRGYFPGRMPLPPEAMALRGKYVTYYPSGQIREIDGKSVYYGPSGRIDRIGSDYVHYGFDGRMSRVGFKSVTYNIDGTASF